MWKEEVIACSEILSQHLLGETKEMMMKDISHNILSPVGDSSPDIFYKRTKNYANSTVTFGWGKGSRSVYPSAGRRSFYTKVTA
jgi:hypothetical protein